MSATGSSRAAFTCCRGTSSCRRSSRSDRDGPTTFLPAPILNGDGDGGATDRAARHARRTSRRRRCAMPARCRRRRPSICGSRGASNLAARIVEGIFEIFNLFDQDELHLGEQRVGHRRVSGVAASELRKIYAGRSATADAAGREGRFLVDEVLLNAVMHQLGRRLHVHFLEDARRCRC